jgi:hypothetical protein
MVMSPVGDRYMATAGPPRLLEMWNGSGPQRAERASNGALRCACHENETQAQSETGIQLVRNQATCESAGDALTL